jgi:D-amino peptidase
MRVYVSADIEGITGVTTRPDDTSHGGADFQMAREQMSAEAAAACEGALAAGATDILVNDGHGSGRNIIAAMLPEQARLVRGWSQHPLDNAQLEGLDNSFDAVVMIGCHAAGGSDGNPLAHTFSSAHLRSWKINGLLLSECMFASYAAAWVGVPVVFVSGDEAVCQDARALNPQVMPLAVKEGVGDSTISMHPRVAVRRTRDMVEQALRRDLRQCLASLPAHFAVEVGFVAHRLARKCSFYPGARQVDPHTVAFETDDYFEVLRFKLFT